MSDVLEQILTMPCEMPCARVDTAACAVRRGHELTHEHMCIYGFKAMTTILSTETSERLAATFGALADPTRIRLVSAIFAGEQCVHDLSTILGLEQSTVSHQLRLLRDRGLVRRRKDGRHAYYVLDDSHVKDLFAFAVEHARHTRSDRRARAR